MLGAKRASSRRVRLWLAAIAVANAAPIAAQQQVTARDSIGFALAEVIPLHEGVNRVDLAGGGSSGMVTVGRRENFNAHSRTTLTAYLSPDPNHWDLVTFWSDSAPERDDVSTSEGADCALQDIRLVRPAPGAPVSVVVAHRDLTGAYTDPSPVVFDLYELRRNRDELVGWPASYYFKVRTLAARRRYCDVDQALAQELGLGTAGLYGMRFR